MTDVQAVIEKANETIAGWITESQTPSLSKVAAQLRTPYEPPPLDGDPRRVVDEWPPPAHWINYSKPVSDRVLGATMGPMLSIPHVADPIFYTVVAVDGCRAGVAYGLFKLADA